MTTKVMSSPKQETCHEQDVQHLFKAISKGKAHLTRFMLAASGPTLINCFNDEGRTPLMECCYIKEEMTRVNMVKTIRDAGADVNQKDEYGRTALIHACQQRCNDVVRLLIMHCQIIPDVEDSDGNTALIHSSSMGNDIAVELLVRNFRRLGLQVDHFNKEGYTALHIAARNGFLQCAKILASKGKATLTLKDKVNNLTPLEICLENGYQKSEVDYLKPSVKFYKVAKLTTTMVKYRKRSSTGQDSISSVASRISPAKAVDKVKQKSKALLKRAKPQGNGNDNGCSEESTAHTLTQQNSLDQNDPPNCVDQDKKKSFFRKNSKKGGQQQSNGAEGKSVGMKCPSFDEAKEGSAKCPPVIKLETDNTGETYKVHLHPNLLTASSTDNDDFDESREFENNDMDDRNVSSAATDMTLLALSARQGASNTPSDIESPVNRLLYYNNNTSNKNNNERGLQTPSQLGIEYSETGECQQTNEADSRDYMTTGEDESCESGSVDPDCESVSSCTLPSMSPVAPPDYSNMNNYSADDGEFESLDIKRQKTPFKKQLEKAGNDSSSPQTEVEYIQWEEDQTNTSDSKSEISNDIKCSDGLHSGNTCDEKVNFDDIVTGEVLKFIDDVTTSEFCDHNETDVDKMEFTKAPGYAKPAPNPTRNVQLSNTKDILKESQLSVDRSDSCSPETIIESLETMSIPKGV